MSNWILVADGGFASLMTVLIATVSGCGVNDFSVEVPHTFKKPGRFGLSYLHHINVGVKFTYINLFTISVGNTS